MNIIKILCDKYDSLRAANKLSIGYETLNISEIILLNEDGTIYDVVETKKEGSFPEKEGLSSGSIAYVMDYRLKYIFGRKYDKKTNSFSVVTKEFEMNKEKNLEFISDIDTPIVNAYRKFLENYNPEDDKEFNKLTNYALKFDKLDKDKYAFALASNPGKMLHEDEEVIKRWNNICLKKELGLLDGDSELEDMYAECAITGKNSKIAKLHKKIPGLEAKLCCSNSDSEYSYGHEKGYMASISEEAMLKYVRALGYLLTNKKNGRKTNTFMMDDVAYVYFAMSDNQNAELVEDLFSETFADNRELQQSGEEDLGNIMDKVKNMANDSDETSSLNFGDVDFYIIGLKKYMSRISIKFCYKNSFNNIIKNIVQHQEDISINSLNKKPVKLWQLRQELIDKDKKETMPFYLADSLINSILFGREYSPQVFLKAIDKCVREVFKKPDDDSGSSKNYSISRTRIGIVKGCLNRKDRCHGRKEEITMSLNKENKNPAYLSGRLLAVVEKIQNANKDNKKNKTVVDNYLGAAIRTPSKAFPMILQIATHNISSIDSPGIKIYHEKLLEEVLSGIGDNFPKTLRPEDQGRFLLGFYQQREDFFTGKNQENQENEEQE